MQNPIIIPDGLIDRQEAAQILETGISTFERTLSPATPEYMPDFPKAIRLSRKRYWKRQDIIDIKPAYQEKRRQVQAEGQKQSVETRKVMNSIRCPPKKPKQKQPPEQATGSIAAPRGGLRKYSDRDIAIRRLNDREEWEIIEYEPHQHPYNNSGKKKPRQSTRLAVMPDMQSAAELAEQIRKTPKE